MEKSNLKKNKIQFVVKESNFSSRVKKRWRFPRGKHSAVRQMHKGRPKMPNPGFGTSKEIKGLHSSGFKPVLVNNLSNISNLNIKVEGAIISSNVGLKNKLEMLKLAKEKNIKVLNVKDLVLKINKLTNIFDKRKSLKKEKTKKRKKSQEESKRQAAKKKEKSEKEEVVANTKKNNEETLEKEVLQKTEEIKIENRKEDTEENEK